MSSAAYWIDGLQLSRHPEGGCFRETYRSAESIAAGALPARFDGDRAFSTAIYFLLEGEDFSALHRIRQDEVWHFYDGSPLDVHVIEASGESFTLRLGRSLEAGEVLQAVVPAGCWFGASVSTPDAWSLVGCTVAPGFDFADFEMPTRDELCEMFPQHRELIRRLTRQ